MKPADFKTILGFLDPETLVPQWLADGQRKGKEWVSYNPMRADKTPGSFSVNLLTGRWKDFAGDTSDCGKDLISLYAYLFHDNDQGAAARELAQTHGVRMDDPAAQAEGIKRREEKVKQIADAQPRLVMPIPASAPTPTFEHNEFGMPAATWCYRTAKGTPLLYVARFDPKTKEERKQLMPRTWCEHPGKAPRWTWRGITGDAPRPLYGLEVLAANPDADVLLVEGEKTADRARELFGDTMVVVTWLGGCPTAQHVDLSALAGRNVILWPDFDAQREKLTQEEKAAGVDPDSKPLLAMHKQPGFVAMTTHATRLKGLAESVAMVGYKVDPAQAGWDLGDAAAAGWDVNRVRAYMHTHLGDPVHMASGSWLPAGEAHPTPADDRDDDDAEEDERVGDIIPLRFDVPYTIFPHRSTNEQPRNTVENLRALLRKYGITARYNQVRKQVEVTLPGRNYTADNRANCSLAELTSLCARNRMPQANLQEYVKLIADRNAYNPAADWITSKPWDGVERIKQLLATITSSGPAALKDALMYRWLLSAVAAIFMPFGFEGHGCLVFTGPQGLGKTTWIRRLVPSNMGLVLVGAMLDPSNKDTVTNAVAHWIVELGELDATFKKADIARLKSFLPLAVDKLRRPYDRIESEYQRRTVFCASVNEERYLVDETGNRRWWTVPVATIDYSHTIDMQQLWAEVLVHHQRGEQHHLTPEENAMLSALNAEHETVDPVTERIQTRFNWQDPGVGTEMTATDVLIAIGYDKPSRKQATECSAVLKKLTGKEPRKKNDGRYFNMPRMIARPMPSAPHDDGSPFGDGWKP